MVMFIIISAGFQEKALTYRHELHGFLTLSNTLVNWSVCLEHQNSLDKIQILTAKNDCFSPFANWAAMLRVRNN